MAVIIAAKSSSDHGLFQHPLAITLTTRPAGVLSVIAFHEKAGRSQVESVLVS